MTPHGNRYGDLVLVLTMLAWLVPVIFVLRSGQRARAMRHGPTDASAPSEEDAGAGKAGFGWARRPTGLLLGGVLVLIASVVVVGAALDRRDDRNTPAAKKAAQLARFGSARDGLCDAAAQAFSGELADVRDIFFHLHQNLHDLAAAAEAVDRAAAARLLEAKAVVEANLQRVSTSIAADFDALAGVSGQALALVGGTDPGPCQA